MKRRLKDKYVVEATYNYSMFKDLLGNRGDVEKRKKRVLQSIKEVGLIPAPIVINEKNEVIDGQARLAAFRELSIPVYYMRVPGLTLEDCIAMNKNGTPWGLPDYINSFAQQGNENYQILKQFNSKHEKLHMDLLAWVLTGNINARQKIKSGDFKVDLEWVKDADSVVSEIHEILDGLKISGRIVNLHLALGYCLKKPEIDNERLKDRVRKRAFTFQSYSNIADWIDAISEAYNYKTKSTLQVPIRALWETDGIKKKMENLKK